MNRIDKIKEFVAKINGFDNLFGTHWNTAMQYTHRRKKQIELYEEVLKMMDDYLNSQKENKEKK